MRPLPLLAAALAVSAAFPALAAGKPARPPGKTQLIQRGGYLVRVAGCHDCHTPMRFDKELGAPVPMMERMLSGHPADAPDPVGKYAQGDMGVMGATMTSFAMPFGIVYAPNLTPDVETGLGRWTEQQFMGALRTGRHMGLEDGRPVLPPMPWPNLAAATDEDLRAIWAYLRSIPPVKNQVPENKVTPEAIAELEKVAGKMEAMMAKAKK
ncbi:diheme cytochrome c-553 [Anaeromyxobacter paludicola]|uniref:Cytochrome c domain-containing protein n=1 Tax=Anaeromyxobacter paludicola TaxID=2918171 RepID=A0ABM7XED4_9BACT|nr:diheme cytochrome c-553 [Anaeromyxobacter paludicola]BDG10238.1 hypothetical protein AMPC_33510 [Anaeromyxobacter paludicola]